jgi:uncharacterized membrane protein YhaH (DUF805 family)
MKDGLAAGFEPLRRYADFTGRSRRSELALFWALTMLAGIIVKWTESAIYFSGSSLEPDWFSILFGAVLLCPWAALSVRRLHDSGRSGWWLLLAAPALLINLWDSWLRMTDAFAVTLQSRLPTFVLIPLGLALLTLMVLLLWDDEEGSNRYGPNPRYGSPEEAV